MSSFAHSSPQPVAAPAGRLRATAARAGRDLLYLTVGLATSVVAFATWLAGGVATITLLPFVVGLPVALGVALAMRGVTSLDRRNTVVLDGTVIPAAHAPLRGPLGARMRTAFRDPQTWRDLGWLMLHSVVGFGFGVVALTVAATTVSLAVLPLWFWALPDGAQFGLWNADTLPLAAVSALLAVPCAAVAVWLLRGMAAAQGSLARRLLGPR